MLSGKNLESNQSNLNAERPTTNQLYEHFTNITGDNFVASQDNVIVKDEAYYIALENFFSNFTKTGGPGYPAHRRAWNNLGKNAPEDKRILQERSQAVLNSRKTLPTSSPRQPSLPKYASPTDENDPYIIKFKSDALSFFRILLEEKKSHYYHNEILEKGVIESICNAIFSGQKKIEFYKTAEKEILEKGLFAYLISEDKQKVPLVQYRNPDDDGNYSEAYYLSDFITHNIDPQRFDPQPLIVSLEEEAPSLSSLTFKRWSTTSTATTETLSNTTQNNDHTPTPSPTVSGAKPTISNTSNNPNNSPEVISYWAYYFNCFGLFRRTDPPQNQQVISKLKDDPLKKPLLK